MKILDKIFKKLRFAESVVEEDEGWRRLTGTQAEPLTPVQFQRAVKYSRSLYYSNPLAKGIIETYVDFILGEGLIFNAEDKRVQEVLDRFWEDDTNNMHILFKERIRDFFIDGDAFWTTRVLKNGHVMLGYIDPLSVTDVIRAKDNPLIADEIVLGGLETSMRLKVIRKDIDPRSTTYGRRVGDVFHFKINSMLNSLRGVPELLQLIDWIDGYDQFLFGRLYKQGAVNNYCWDVTIEGADDDDLRRFSKNIKPPSPGEVRLHNEKVKWTVISPKLESQDAVYDSKMIRAHILSGAGLPPHWFADPEGVRAVAYEMGFPTEKRLVSRQKYIKHMLSFVFKYVIDQSILSQSLPKDVNTKFDIIFPEISVRDLQRVSRSLTESVSALTKATERGWVTNDEARKIIRSIVAQIGVDLTEKKGGNNDNAK